MKSIMEQFGESIVAAVAGVFIILLAYALLHESIYDVVSTYINRIF